MSEVQLRGILTLKQTQAETHGCNESTGCESLPGRGVCYGVCVKPNILQDQIRK